MTPLDLAPRPGAPATFAQDTRAALSAAGAKRLAPKYLYDALGSALFEAITQLPEYGVWRAERRLLREHAGPIAELARAANVVELGSGSASKTLPLIEALLSRRAVSYCAIDVSPAALDMTRRQLAGVRGLGVRTLEGEYDDGLDAALRAAAPRGRTLVLFLGSSLGNFDTFASLRFLRRLRQRLRPGDSLLLGADLEKPVARLLAAYDDALGVTAAFNLNLLARMNRELGADFVLPRFRHRARFNAAVRSVEMHIESCERQVVRFAEGWTASFEAGETLHTENSHKYSLDELSRLLGDSGFRREAHWVEPEWQFSSGLFVPD